VQQSTPSPVPEDLGQVGRYRLLAPLGKGGAGGADLPAYVGALPPEGVAAWDWERIWKAAAR
jgi:hypothetical protein